MNLRSVKGAVPLRNESAVILLEVVLALALFVGAAAIFTATMNSSMASLERQTLNLHAENLASSLLAEIQIGARSVNEGGTVTLDPVYEGWSAEIITGPAQHEIGETTMLTQVEVVVRHTNSLAVRRLAQTMDLNPRSAGGSGGMEEP